VLKQYYLVSDGKFHVWDIRGSLMVYSATSETKIISEAPQSLVAYTSMFCFMMTLYRVSD